jgi:hypothetical protein
MFPRRVLHGEASPEDQTHHHPGHEQGDYRQSPSEWLVIEHKKPVNISDPRMFSAVPPHMPSLSSIVLYLFKPFKES